MGKHSTRTGKRKGRIVIIVVCVLFALAVLSCAVLVVVRPPFAEPVLQQMGIPSVGALLGQPASTPGQRDSSESGNAPANSFSAVADTTLTDDELQAEKQAWKQAHQTPLIAQSAGVDLRCSIDPAEITGILFHQASYEYALVLETQIPDADYDTVADSRTMRINPNQQGTEWLDAEALHLWRTQDDTEMDTSIDIGALPGTAVLSPVDGTVVLVKDYMLYDEMPDIEIHIQPDGRPDLDCVLIHTTNPLVKAGDRVEAGITELSQVREIEEYLDDVQLGFFVAEGVGGNHVHVQMNDANFAGYRENKLAGAVSV